MSVTREEWDGYLEAARVEIAAGAELDDDVVAVLAKNVTVALYGSAPIPDPPRFQRGFHEGSRTGMSVSACRPQGKFDGRVRLNIDSPETSLAEVVALHEALGRLIAWTRQYVGAGV